MSSDEEIYGTKFTDPSPLKKRSIHLPDPKKRKELLRKRELLKTKLKKTDELFITYLTDVLKEGDSQLAETYLNVAKPNEIHLFPRDRRFFVNTEDNHDPSSWFPEGSMLHDLTVKKFLSYVKQGFLARRAKAEDEETRLLRLYCLSLLSTIEDEFTACLLIHFVSSHPIPFKDVSLKTRGSPHFGRLLLALEKSVASYNEEETRELFRDVIVASLDPITFSMTLDISSFLDSFLQVLPNQFKVMDEVDWIMQQRFQPEEFSHLIKVFPQAGPSVELRSIFCKKALENLLQATETEHQVFTLESLVEFIEEHRGNFPKIPLNSVYHFLNIFSEVFLRFPSYNHVNVCFAVFCFWLTYYSSVLKSGVQDGYLKLEVMNEALILKPEN